MSPGRPSSPCLRGLARLGDGAAATLAITPVVVFYWAATWRLVEIYVPGDEVTACLISLAVGVFVSVLSYPALWLLRSGELGADTQRPRAWLLHVLVSRAFNYVCAAGGIFYWRGAWDLADHCLGETLWEAVLSFWVTTAIQTVLRVGGQALGVPLAVLNDSRDDFYEARPRFRREPNKNSFLLYMADVTFTVLFVLPLSVFLWRSLWNMMDALIFPGDLFTSYCVSVAAGYASIWLLLALEPALHHASGCCVSALGSRGHGSVAGLLTLEAAVTVPAGVAVLLMWRGMWGLVKDFVLVPGREHELAECWLTHLVSILALMAMDCSSTLAQVDITLDGEDALETGGFRWPVDYVSYFVFRRHGNGGRDAADYRRVTLITDDFDGDSVSDGEDAGRLVTLVSDDDDDHSSVGGGQQQDDRLTAAGDHHRAENGHVVTGVSMNGHVVSEGNGHLVSDVDGQMVNGVENGHLVSDEHVHVVQSLCDDVFGVNNDGFDNGDFLVTEGDLAAAGTEGEQTTQNMGQNGAAVLNECTTVTFTAQNQTVTLPAEKPDIVEPS